MANKVWIWQRIALKSVQWQPFCVSDWQWLPKLPSKYRLAAILRNKAGLDWIKKCLEQGGQAIKDWLPFWAAIWQRLPDNKCICCISGQSDRTDKELGTGQLFIQFLGGSSGPEQINQLRTSFFWLICKKSQLIPSRISINRAEIPYSLSVLTDHSFWWHLSSRAKKPGGLAPLCKNR